MELELVKIAIQRLVEERKIKETSSTDCLVQDDVVDDQLLLSKLLSQVLFDYFLKSIRWVAQPRREENSNTWDGLAEEEKGGGG